FFSRSKENFMNQTARLKAVEWMRRYIAFLLCLTPVPVLAAASDALHEQILEDQLSVRELMRREAIQAGASSIAGFAGMQGAGDSEVVPVISTQTSGPRLVAIYGTGHRLLAQVDIGGNHYLYMQGQPQAMGRRNPEVTYVLDSISKSCVRLLDAETPHTLCLHPDF